MAAKVAKPPLGGMHTAGIFSDMTVDGPDIGTLVLIVDRAKNLPNRKTMGKQDPYCAARLGKEAKRTETDKRGGQTPRWDQELRFTVHDSADYYQLKVSVFNDDKKTDLIGETWVDLEKVVVHGGGQNDLWHTLNCRGRYAGEIRIELTYYDTRPKEEPLIEQRRESARPGTEGGVKDAIGGPRQAKQVKRRPLPADPTSSPGSRPLLPDHTQCSPLPQRGHKNPPSPHHHSPHQSTDYATSNQTAAYTYHTHTPSSLSYLQPLSETSQNFDPEMEAMMQAQQPDLSAQFNDQDVFASSNHHDDESYARHQSDLEANGPDNSTYHGQEHFHSQSAQREDYQNVAPPPPSHSRHASPAAVPLGLTPSQSFTHMNSALPPSQKQSSPELMGEGHGQMYSNNSNDTYESSSLQRNPFSDSPLRHFPPGSGRGNGRGAMQPTVEDEDIPPPPPAHRRSGNQMTLFNGQAQSVSIPVTSPAPLNIPSDKAKGLPNYHQGSPTRQSQVQIGYGSASMGYGNSPSSVSESSRTSFGHQTSAHTGNIVRRSPVREISHVTPPSLVPGYDPTVAEVLSERLGQKRGTTDSEFGQREQPPTYRGPPSYEDPPQSRAQTYQQQSIRPPRAEMVTRSGQEEARHPPTPIANPRAVSPDTRIPARKSVSPQPGPPPEERRLTAAPFGPDSYNAFNPNAGSSAASSQPGAQYQTPERAKEAFGQRQQEAFRPEGPILSSDGRVIDPSDHLPTDTWAPEPERKTPKHTPEPAVRSRPSPIGAQPMPPGSRRQIREGVARPHSISTPVYAHATDLGTPASSARVRLQQKTRMSSTQPASSPLVPTLNNTPRSLPRTTASDFPLRERENYGYGNGPIQGDSPAAPPKVSDKIPFQSHHDDYAAISEEMKSIDIGVGSWSGRARRSRS